MMLKASLLAFVAFLAVACAAPSVFLGGAFTQVDGVWSPGLGAFNTETQTWSHYPIGLSGTINSLAAVRNGTFAVGTFTSVGSSQSQHVAFWDGVKWCPIRQGIAGNGLGVVCDSDTSCWVAGDFTGVYNLEVEEPPRNFVHYQYNTNTHEWEIDTAALNWNNASGDPAPVISIDSLDYIGSGNSLFFFALSGNQLFRGSAVDEGWFLKAGGANVNTGATLINDYSINPEGTTLYVVTNAAGDAISSLTGGPLSSACGGACTPTSTSDWASVVSGATPPYNASVFNEFSAIVAGPSDTRYLIGVYDPDGLDPYFAPRQRVLQQTGSGQPTLVGSPFAVSTSPLLTQIGLSENNAPLVVGTFVSANLIYPTTPNTNDIEGLLGDRRPLDAINGIAVYDSAASRWVPFGAGGISGTPSGNVRMTYNSLTNEWFVADEFSFVYDTHAVGLAYHETTEDAFFPVLTRALLRRGSSSPGPATVYEVVCESSDCDAVFVGGDFTFHGPDTFGAILRAVVKTSGEPELTAVGGGLWDSSVDYYLNDTAFQVQSGQVAALKVVSGHLYAGGEFTRTHPSAGFHCLNNIARIDASNLNGQWEDLAGGCDNSVFDIEEFQGRLYVGGQFAKCGDVIVNSVASYSYGATTPAWSSLNHGVNGGAVYSLEPFQGRLIVGGSFTHAGGLPVTGVASWDGTKWRALVPACSDDCVPGDLRGYYNVPEQPTNVWGLQRDSTGRNLFATGEVEGDRYLVRWHYTEGDFGQWLVKGVVQHNDQDIGHSVAIFVDNQILVAGSSSGVIGEEQPNLGAWDQNAENIAVTTNVGGTVYVARGPAGGSAGSASTLSSMLSPLLAYVF